MKPQFNILDTPLFKNKRNKILKNDAKKVHVMKIIPVLTFIYKTDVMLSRQFYPTASSS